MAGLHRTSVTLRVMGADLDPEEVIHLLGCAPSTSTRAGDMRRIGRDRAVAARHGSWRLRADDACPGDLDAQVDAILARLTEDLSVWRDLSERYRCDVFCGFFMRDGNEGASLEPGTLAKLGARGLRLDMDVYGPSD